MKIIKKIGQNNFFLKNNQIMESTIDFRDPENLKELQVVNQPTPAKSGKLFENQIGHYNQKEEFLTPIEVCEYLKIKRSTIYDWVYRKKICFIKLGRLLRFKKSEIEKLLANNH